MSIATSDGTPLVSGVPLLNGADLFGRFSANAAMPAGFFYVHDETGQGESPNLANVGVSCLLCYREASNVDE
jgi:hypothetical protein